MGGLADNHRTRRRIGQSRQLIAQLLDDGPATGVPHDAEISRLSAWSYPRTPRRAVTFRVFVDVSWKPKAVAAGLDRRLGEVGALPQLAESLGGSPERIDQSAEATLRREALEESQVDATGIEHLG